MRVLTCVCACVCVCVLHYRSYSSHFTAHMTMYARRADMAVYLYIATSLRTNVTQCERSTHTHTHLRSSRGLLCICPMCVLICHCAVCVGLRVSTVRTLIQPIIEYLPPLTQTIRTITFHSMALSFYK